MATTTLHQTITTGYAERASKASLYKRFINWCEGQDSNRLLWLGVALMAHGCIITPITVIMVLLAGTNLFLFVLALIAMGATLVTNLAALPTKITIPVFILSTLIDIAIIFSCVFIGLDIAKTYI
jgi:hypothetical protein